ncbi:hypothetical protein LTR15_006583 [Elasticomyces elasticus]|nr:hypothetical protein LTR15_006583 [Elasticomyces elasticus]
MNGVLVAILLLLGFPGTGKSRTLGTRATQCSMMGFRVLLVSQSNKGVDAVFVGTTGVMQLSGQGNLLERCVRVMSELKETALAQEIVTNIQANNTIGIFAGNHWTARYIQRFCEEFPEDDIPTVLALMRNKILATAKIVGCTAFVATTLANTDCEPDMLIFDEAGQVTDTDLMVALLGNITRLKKVILGGDPAQVPPVVVSQTSQHNSLGSVIEKFALQRIQEVYPHFSRVELNEAYRGHHSTFAASSKIFYDGKMIAGELEPNGTSYYNPNGVMATAIFVQMIVDSGVKPKEIGVISMYNEDVRRIRQELAERGIEGVEVSTLDGYQGSEKEVMVVHFVAAFPDRQDPFAFFKRPQQTCK